MDATSYPTSKALSASVYLDDPRPWLVGFSGGKDSTMLASLIVEVVAGIPDGQRKKPVAVQRVPPVSLQSEQRKGHHDKDTGTMGAPF